MADKKSSDSKKGKPSSAGKRKGKFDGLFARVLVRKLRRVLKNSGRDAAEKYAAKNGLMPEFNKLVESGLVERRRVARERRRKSREARLAENHEFRLNRRNQHLADEATRKVAAEKKAKRRNAALKAAATRRAKKAVVTEVAAEASV